MHISNTLSGSFQPAIDAGKSDVVEGDKTTITTRDGNTKPAVFVRASTKSKPKPKKKPAPAPFVNATPFNGALFSRDIIAKREKDNLTQRQAAKAISTRNITVSDTAVHDMEANQSCNIKRLHLVCNWLGYPVYRYFTHQK